jgi:hypothetical protein
MNAKKAKALRALTKQLQHKGVIENQEWAVYGSQQHRQMANPSSIISSNPADHEEPRWIVQNTRMLDPTCGKSMYKQMKKRANDLTGRAR